MNENRDYFGKKLRKEIDATPFDTKRIPPKQNLFFMPFLWLGCWIMTRRGRLKIHRVNMEGLKPPYIVLGTHHSFTDFYVTPLALFPHRANYVSELEGFEAYGEWLYRQLGCLGTRKFINDVNLVKNIKRVMERKGILVLYPEARYANVGTSSEIPISVSKLIKLLKVPVVVLQMHGNYLQSPIWNLKKRKEARLEATITRIFTGEQVRDASVREIQDAIKKSLQYDEYAWQEARQMKITFRDRAKGLHMPLYQCRCCETEFSMCSEGSRIFCTACGAEWDMDEYGKLNRNNTSVHIPDWYEWERENVKREIDAGTYNLDCKVRVEALPNAVNFIDCGEGRLRHKKEGFYLTFQDFGDTEQKTLFFSSKSLFSIHTEYDYRGKGQCVTLSTNTNTYFLFPLEEGFQATKIQFAVEYFTFQRVTIPF